MKDRDKREELGVRRRKSREWNENEKLGSEAEGSEWWSKEVQSYAEDSNLMQRCILF